MVTLGCAIIYSIIMSLIFSQNLLLREDGLVKIADFGISQMITDGEKLSNAAGTPAFMSPELCQMEAKSTFSGQLADVWAIGATMFMLRFGHPPWVAKTIINLYAKIVNDPLVFPGPLDPALKNLFERVLEKNPAERMTLDQIMKHPWMMTMPAAPPPVTPTAGPQRKQQQQQQQQQQQRASTAQGTNKDKDTNSSSSAGESSSSKGSLKGVSSDSSSAKHDLNVATSVLKATGKLKSFMNFRPPESYAAEEEAAMQQPVQTIDQQEVYASIGGIQKVKQPQQHQQQQQKLQQKQTGKAALVHGTSKIDENVVKGDGGDSSDSDDSSDGDYDAAVMTGLGATNTEINSAEMLAAIRAKEEARDGPHDTGDKDEGRGQGKEAMVTKDIMDTGWGNDVFGMVEDDGDSNDDDSVDDDDDDDDDGDVGIKKAPAGGAGAGAGTGDQKGPQGSNPSHSSSAGSADSGNSLAPLEHTEMTQAEQERRALHFAKKVKAKASSSNMKYTASVDAVVATGRMANSAAASAASDKIASSAATRAQSSGDRTSISGAVKGSEPSPCIAGDRGAIGAATDDGRKVSFKAQQGQMGQMGGRPPGSRDSSSSDFRLNSAHSERTLSPCTSGRSPNKLSAGGLNLRTLSRMSQQSQDDLDETTDQLTMEDFSKMMDTLAMQPNINEGDDDEDEEMHKRAAELSIQGFCAELHNLKNGVAAAFNSEKGNRHSQEDRCVLVPNVAELIPAGRLDARRLEQLSHFTMACLFDGHNGWRCSHYLSQNMPLALAMHQNFLDKQCEVAISQTCETIDNEVRGGVAFNDVRSYMEQLSAVSYFVTISESVATCFTLLYSILACCLLALFPALLNDIATYYH